MIGPHLFIKDNNSFYWIRKENPVWLFIGDKDKVFKGLKKKTLSTVFWGCIPLS